MISRTDSAVVLPGQRNGWLSGAAAWADHRHGGARYQVQQADELILQLAQRNVTAPAGRGRVTARRQTPFVQSLLAEIRLRLVVGVGYFLLA